MFGRFSNIRVFRPNPSKLIPLIIGKGRLGTVKNTGTYTYFVKHACSTIDYLFLFKHDFQLINEFSIGRFKYV